jgi:hypothetical protein
MVSVQGWVDFCAADILWDFGSVTPRTAGIENKNLNAFIINLRRKLDQCQVYRPTEYHPSSYLMIGCRDFDQTWWMKPVLEEYGFTPVFLGQLNRKSGKRVSMFIRENPEPAEDHLKKFGGRAEDPVSYVP